MRHGESNVLKWQGYCEYLRAPPLNSVECARVVLVGHSFGGAVVIAAGTLTAQCSVRMSPFAQMVQITLNVVPITQTL